MKQKYSRGIRLHIGMRNVKTAIAATLCALLYFIVDRNPTFACIGAIFGTGSDMADSKLNGGNRLFGTIIGGVIGMLLYPVYLLFYPEGGWHYILLLFLFIGVIVLVLTSLSFGWPGAIQPGGVVLCIIFFNTPADTYISYSLNRIFDTAFGVAIAIAINLLFPRERVVRWLDKIGIHKLDDME
ncbi:MAG: aromatic acid exporter family protein [Faecalimonas sp.]|nr:aromatic acid exporter family protein [Faecalimonas sp.]